MSEVRASHLLVKHQGSRRPASWRDPDGERTWPSLPPPPFASGRSVRASGGWDVRRRRLR